MIESCPCNSKDEAHAREGHYIRTMNCVNKYIPNRTRKEYKEDNKEKLHEYNSNYHKQYQQDNKEHIKEYKHNWNEENKEEISLRRNAPIVCHCGITTSLRNKARHEKSKHHLNFIAQQNI